MTTMPSRVTESINSKWRDSMKTINIQLPSFGGFYESLWRNSDTEYWELKEMDDNLEFGMHLEHLDDWGISSTYQTDVCKAYTEFMRDKLRELGLNIDLQYEAMTSPSYYNFETDKIWADLTYTGNELRYKLLALMRAHEVHLTNLIARYHTSCDGFWSWMDNDYHDWYRRIARWDKDSDRFGLYVSYLLTYIVMCENGFDDLHDLDESAYMEVTDWKGIYPTSYLEPQTDEAKEEWAQYEQKVEYRRMLERDQLSINFDIAM